MGKRRWKGLLWIHEHRSADHRVILYWTWRIYLGNPSVWIQSNAFPRLRPSALRAARKAAERLGIEIRSIDGEAV